MSTIYEIIRDTLYYYHKLEFARYTRLRTQSNDRSKIEYYEEQIMKKELELLSELKIKYE